MVKEPRVGDYTAKLGYATSMEESCRNKYMGGGPRLEVVSSSKRYNSALVGNCKQNYNMDNGIKRGWINLNHVLCAKLMLSQSIICLLRALIF
jgi:hypothetical protein